MCSEIEGEMNVTMINYLTLTLFYYCMIQVCPFHSLSVNVAQRKRNASHMFIKTSSANNNNRDEQRSTSSTVSR